MRIPSGALLLPALVGAALNSSHIAVLPVPELAAGRGLCADWLERGMTFHLPDFLLALRTLPQMLVSIFGLMLLCGGLVWMLTPMLDIDLMTANLATSPDGLDAVAMIVAGTQVNMAFVMAMQTLGVFIILLTGPASAHFISRYARTGTE